MKREIYKLMGIVMVMISFTITSCDKYSETFSGNDEVIEDLSLKSAKVTSSSVSSVVMTQEEVSVSVCGEVVMADFLAGQHFEAGVLYISNTDEKLFVSVVMNDNWVISQTHVYVGPNENLPANKKGNPQIGQFPVKDTFDNYATVVTYAFDLADLDDQFMIAFHANVHKLNDAGELIQSETAWASGEQMIESGSWASYLVYTVQECNGCIIEPVEYEMFGGQTIPVGNLIVTNDTENLYVTYDGNNGWQFATVQLYVGSLDGLPTNKQNTPVPGSFPLKDESSSLREVVVFTIPLSSLPSCYIIAAHGEAVLTNTLGESIQSETSWSFGTEFPNTNRWGWYSIYCTQTCSR